MELKFGKYKGQKVVDVAKIAEGRSWLAWHSGSLDLNDPKWGANNRKAKEYIDAVLKQTANNTSHGEPKEEHKPSSPSGESFKLLSETIGMMGKKIDAKIEELKKGQLEIKELLRKLDANSVAGQFGGEVLPSTPAEIKWED